MTAAGEKICKAAKDALEVETSGAASADGDTTLAAKESADETSKVETARGTSSKKTSKPAAKVQTSTGAAGAGTTGAGTARAGTARASAVPRTSRVGTLSGASIVGTSTLTRAVVSTTAGHGSSRDGRHNGCTRNLSYATSRLFIARARDRDGGSIRSLCLVTSVFTAGGRRRLGVVAAALDWECCRISSCDGRSAIAIARSGGSGQWGGVGAVVRRGQSVAHADEGDDSCGSEPHVDLMIEISCTYVYERTWSYCCVLLKRK